MSFFSLLRVEFARLVRSRRAWLVCALALLSPLLGYAFYLPASNQTRASQLLANPALAGGVGAALLFALLTVLELDRARRAGITALTDAVASPLAMNAARLCAVLCLGVLTGFAALLCYLPYTALRMANVFDLHDFILCYLGILSGGAALGCLMAGALYFVTQRVEVSFISMAAMALLSMSNYLREDFILRWINPIIPILSDDFSNRVALEMMLYNRAIWLLALVGFVLIAALCIRRYGRGLLGSFRANLRKAYLPVLGSVLIAAACLGYTGQPFVNRAAPDVFDPMVEWPDEVEMLACEIDGRPDLTWGRMNGTARYRMRNDNPDSTPVQLSINPGYTVRSLTIDGKPVAFTDKNDDVVREKHIEFLLPSGEDMLVEAEYGGYPQMWSIARSFMGDSEIERRYIYLVGPAFAPVMEAIWAKGMETVARVSLPESMNALVMDGTADREGAPSGGLQAWKLASDGPHIYLYAADYIAKDVSTPNMAVDFYYSKKHEAVMERVNIEKTLREVLDYATEHIGTLSFAEDDRLKLVQMSAFMGGGYASSGMSVMGESSLVEEGLNDPLKGASGSEVMAHEIIHQWWGLGRMFDEYSEGSDPEWSSEGFTVYATYRMMKELHGEAYAQEHYVDVWQEQVDALQRDFYHRHPEYLEMLPERYAATVRTEKDEVLKYCQMPLKILKAAELVGGEDKMEEIMKELFITENLKNAPYLGYDDFLAACGLTKEALNLD